MAGNATIETRCRECCDAEAQCFSCATTDSGKVINIFDRQPTSSTVDDHDARPYKDDVISILESMLEDARAGEFIGIAGVLIGEEEISTFHSEGTLLRPVPAIGGLSRVIHELNTEMDLDED